MQKVSATHPCNTSSDDGCFAPQPPPASGGVNANVIRLYILHIMSMLFLPL